MYANTVSRHPTYFMQGVNLVKEARDEFKIPSENWPYPSEYRFGIPNDNYYAEVWTDGMDWQPTYWVIEEYHLEKPHIQPLIIFDYNEERNKFNDWDFRDFIRAMLWYRRDDLWTKHLDLGIYTDTVWPYLYVEGNPDQKRLCNYENNYFFKHASQPKVKFWVNEDFIPVDYRGRIYEENRNSWNEAPGQPGSIL